MNFINYYSDTLIKDTAPSHFPYNENFTKYMDDKKISSFGKWMFNNGFTTGVSSLAMKLKKIYKWINVKDRLPDANGLYIVCKKIRGHSIVFGAVWYNGKWVSVCNRREVQYITHWKPLPDPPEKDDES